jgi:hypothetical protein
MVPTASIGMVEVPIASHLPIVATDTVGIEVRISPGNVLDMSCRLTSLWQRLD